MSEAFQWKPEQQQALDARNVSLAVSAAAGSGKTAVLTERIVRLLASPGGVSADRLCVVTFTKAAAGELEGRLYEALSAAVSEGKGKSGLLARQLFLLDRAHISTIDAFCLDLIRSYRRELGLLPGVRVCEETEEAVLFGEACREGLEAYLSDPAGAAEKERIYALFCTAKKQDTLWGVLDEMKKKAGSVPEGDGFFREKLVALQREWKGVKEEDVWRKTAAGRYFSRRCEEIYTRASLLADHLLQELENAPCVQEKRYDFYSVCRAEFQEAARLARAGKLYEADAALTVSLGKSQPQVRGELSPEEAEVKAFCDRVWNDQIKPYLNTVRNEYLKAGPGGRTGETAEFLPLAFSLTDLFEEVMARFSEKKRERNVLSFADLPALVLGLVGEKQGETYVPTAIGREIASRFDAVFVDEYQDTNRVQDAIFRCITTGRNLFVVGDPKQSVYRFRGAEPEVFARYRLSLPDYAPERDTPMARLFLSHNFRCDKSVIDLVNGLFRVLMDETDSESLYKEKDRLKFGKKEENDRRFPAEIILLEKKEEPAETERFEEEEGEKEALWQGKSENREAAWIARRIRSILSGEIRRADGSLYQAGDVAVVARSWRQVGKVRAALAARGIACAWEKSDGAPVSPEELFVKALLEASDNPTRDVPLLAALYSPVFCFTPDDLLALRRACPDGDFFTALSEAVEKKSPLAEKSRAALYALSGIRRAARRMTPTELIFYLYRQYAIEETYRTSSESGAVKKKLLRAAESAQNAGFDTLSRFLTYLKNLTDPDDGAAAGSGVHLMTIHKAKGLEYPIVFVSFLGQYFKRDDGAVRLSSASGVTFTLPRVKGLVRYEHLLDKASREMEARDGIEEEKRILYVALTRAREKLILTGEIRSERALFGRTLFDAEKPLSPALSRLLIQNAQSPLDFLFLALHDEVSLRDGVLTGRGERERLLVQRVALAGEADLADPADEPDGEIAHPLPPWEEVKSYLDFSYAGADLETLPKKLSVSEIVRQGREEEANLLPRCLSDFERGVLKADAAFRGTAMHQAMQFADLSAAARDPAGEIARLREKGFITAKMAKVLELEHFEAFFRSDLFRRIAASPRVVHEKRFNVLLDGESLLGRPGEILIQGVVDLWFEKEDGTLAILDFKTDHLPPDGDEILKERHGEQLRIYRRAVEAMEEKPVTELLLYSFSLDRTVSVPL